jgi:hypothetical protein
VASDEIENNMTIVGSFILSVCDYIIREFI